MFVVSPSPKEAKENVTLITETDWQFGFWCCWFWRSRNGGKLNSLIYQSLQRKYGLCMVFNKCAQVQKQFIFFPNCIVIFRIIRRNERNKVNYFFTKNVHIVFSVNMDIEMYLLAREQLVDCTKQLFVYDIRREPNWFWYSQKVNVIAPD